MIGTRIAHYQITAKLGEGGMGEVYRATDEKLDREVAIKILPEAFAAHPERRARFEREAKSLARLNHPNIAAIHGFDQDTGKWFLVLELIDGETLAERIAKGPLELEEALRVFQQIAEALEAAHDKDIVHRDLKPANIKIDSLGRVKVLDFGLAKARTENNVAAYSGAPPHDSLAPTITSEFTVPGKVMGTAAYMSPEQSRGHEVDKRTDVWAFGCCLYEALTGRRPFKGQTASDLLAEILKTDPDWTTLPAETPRDVVTLLRRCLEKESRRRLRDLGDIAITLEESSKINRFESSSTRPVRVVEDARPRVNETSRTGTFKTPAKALGTVLLSLGFAYAVLDLVLGLDLDFSKKTEQSVESIRSVAVLRIVPKGEESDLTVVADGLEADIRAQLSRIDGLERHPAPRTVEKLAASEKIDSEIAAELGVDGLVYGRISRDGDEINLNVSLVYGPADMTLWETNFTSANPKALESQAVLSLLEQFKVPLTEAERNFLARAENVSIEAYTEYRRGVDALDVTGFSNAEAVISHFRSAIDKAPGFLPPYMHQAWALWWPTIHGAEGTSSEQAFEEAYRVLARAEKAFPTESIIGVTRDFFGMVSEFEFVTAKNTLDEALLASPGDPDLLFMYLWYLVFIDSRYPEALRVVDFALEQDPNRIAFLDAKAEIYSFMGDERKALELNSGIAAENVEDFDRLINNAFSYRTLGELDQALQAATNAVRVARNHPASIAALAEIHAARGDAEEARRLLREVEARRNAGHGISFNWNARVEAQLGDTKAAARSLRKAFEAREGWSLLYSMRNPPITRLMADEPAFWELVEEMNYPPFPITHALHALEKEKRYR